MKLSDRMVGLVSIIGSAYLVSQIWDTQLETKGLPLGCLFLLMILSVMLIARPVTTTYTFDNFKRIILNFILLFVYIVLLNFLGFIPASIIYLTTFIFMNKYEGKKWVGLAYGIFLPIALYAVFELLFAVDLPQGIF